MCYALKSHNAIRLLSYKKKNTDSVRAEWNTTQQRHQVIQRQMKMHTHR